MASQKTVVLITGANSGVGFESAVAIAADSKDYHVILGSRSIEKGQEAIAELGKRNLKGSFSLLQLDVTDEPGVVNAAEAVEKEFGKLDVLINNAGIIVHGNTALSDQVRKTFETNTVGPIVVTEKFLPLLKKSSNARIIYVSSDLGSMARRQDKNYWSSKVPSLPYRVSKAALNMVIAYQSVEFEEYGIKVFGCCPGYVITNLSGTGEKGREERKERGAGSPEVSGQTILSIVDGRRDKDVGKVVHKDGIHPW